MHLTGIILAAGTSSRMRDSNKLLLPYRNHTIIEETLEQLSKSMVDKILVVTGHDNLRVEKVLAGRQSDRIEMVYNPDYLLGRAASIKRGLSMVGDKTDAVLFMVADKPEVSHVLINKAIDRFRKDRPPVLYVEAPTGRGHPIIFDRSLFDELKQLDGDRVGNELVGRYGNDAIVLKDMTPQNDIDTRDDYRALLENGMGK